MKKILLAVGIILLLLVAWCYMTIRRDTFSSVNSRMVRPKASESKPTEPAGKRFGGGVIRKNETPQSEK
jgi:hypothetical protein